MMFRVSTKITIASGKFPLQLRIVMMSNRVKRNIVKKISNYFLVQISFSQQLLITFNDSRDISILISDVSRSTSC